jgi:betaine-aldehyde dehydrogenase
MTQQSASEYSTEYLIGGQLVEAHGEATVTTEDPARGEPLTAVPVADETDIDRAVSAAQDAFAQWQDSAPGDRAAVLERIAACFERNADELAELEVRNNGSTASSLVADIQKAADRLRYFAGLVHDLHGETTEVDSTVVSYTVREPVGVVAGIIPFNHPLSFVGSKIGPALAAGNTIVLKPSEYTPLSALRLAKYIAADDQIPDGVVNIVAGDGQSGAHLTDHEDVDMVTFIGSVETGKQIMESAAKRVVPVHLELGGKNPSIVFPDADIDKAISGCAGAMNLAWQGQSCASGSRCLVHEDVHEAVVDGLRERFESITVGPPNEESTDTGAIVSEPQYEKVLKYIELGKESDAELLAGGDPVDVPGYDGYYVQPALFDDVDPESRIAQEEIFGPVLSVIPWSEYDELIEIANGVPHGLTASIWTQNLRTALETAKRVEAGYIWVNEHGPHYLGTKIGGIKQSGIGKKNSMAEALHHTREKTVNVNLEATEWDWDAP